MVTATFKNSDTTLNNNPCDIQDAKLYVVLGFTAWSDLHEHARLTVDLLIQPQSGVCVHVKFEHRITLSWASVSSGSRSAVGIYRQVKSRCQSVKDLK